MIRHQVVTTFSRQGYELYGKKFIETFHQHWAGPAELVVVTEGYNIPGLDTLDLFEDHEYHQWLRKYDTPENRGTPSCPNMQAIRFSHKVFALTHPGLPEPEGGWRAWVDGDVVFTAEPNWNTLFPNDKALTFLGRENCYSECGFVGYNFHRLDVYQMLEDMRSQYTTGTLFELGENNWHDSYVFDLCRERWTKKSGWNNLSAGLRGDLHVWPRTALGKWAEHAKGPKRKRDSYGGVAP